MAEARRVRRRLSWEASCLSCLMPLFFLIPQKRCVRYCRFFKTNIESFGRRKDRVGGRC